MVVAGGLAAGQRKAGAAETAGLHPGAGPTAQGEGTSFGGPSLGFWVTPAPGNSEERGQPGLVPLSL